MDHCPRWSRWSRWSSRMQNQPGHKHTHTHIAYVRSTVVLLVCTRPATRSTTQGTCTQKLRHTGASFCAGQAGRGPPDDPVSAGNDAGPISGRCCSGARPSCEGNRRGPQAEEGREGLVEWTIGAGNWAGALPRPWVRSWAATVIGSARPSCHECKCLPKWSWPLAGRDLTL